MHERILQIIQKTRNLEELTQLQSNARSQNVLSCAVSAAIRARSVELARDLLAGTTCLDVTDLSPAEEKLFQAVAVYAGLEKLEGRSPNRILREVVERGLLGVAEAAVAKAKPTDASQRELRYDQIVVDHPKEFSPRALWLARRALGLVNNSEKPPAGALTSIQRRTEALLQWLRERRPIAGGPLPPHTNVEAAAALSMADMHRYGRVFGNIQSRIDFACYAAGLPPLGLAADTPFEKAWLQEGRSWAYPIQSMQAAAQSRVWTDKDFDVVLKETERLPGQAYISWKRELSVNEAKVRDWAFRLGASRAPQSMNPE